MAELSKSPSASELSEEVVEVPAWVVTQKKTFTRWINAHLKKKEMEIEDVDTGLADGIKLMNLIHILYNLPIPRHNKNARMRAHQLDNVSLSLEMVKSAGIKLHSVQPMSILDKNLKLTLGTVWSIIHNYQIHGISVDTMSAKEGLLLWCQRKTRGYKDVEINNFSTSWRSGLGFAALIHAHRPDLIDFRQLSVSQPEENLRLVSQSLGFLLGIFSESRKAFSVAEKSLGIPQLLDVEDMLAEKPDEKSVMTYVSEYFHRFATQSEAETAARRVANFLTFSQSKDELTSVYVRDAHAWMEWVQTQTANLQQVPTVSDEDIDVAGAMARIHEFQTYKSSEKPKYASLKVEIENSFSNLQTKLRAFSRPRYIPPSGFALEDLHVAWSELNQTEAAHLDGLRENVKKVKDNLRRLFAEEANGVAAWLSEWNGTIAQVSGSLEEQLTQLTEWKQQLIDNVLTVEHVSETSALCAEAGIVDNPYTEYSAEELALLYDEVKAMLDSRIQLMQNMVGRKQEKDRLAAELAEIERVNEALRVQFATVANEFVPWIQHLRETLDKHGELDQTLQSAKEVQGQVKDGDAKLHELTEVDRKLKERSILDNKHTTYTLGEVELLYEELVAAVANKVLLLENQMNRRREKERLKGEAAALAESRTALKKQFATLAEEFAAFVEQQRQIVTETTGDLQSQQSAVASAILELEKGSATMAELGQINQQVAAAGIDENEFTTLSFEEVSTTYSELVSKAAHKLQFLENQITLVNMQKIPDEKLEEYKSAFKYFDKDNSGLLNKEEFMQALQSLGENISDTEGDQLFKDLDVSGDGHVGFEEFLTYMVERTQDKDTPEQVRAAFQLIASNKDHVLLSELAPYVDAEKLEWIKENAPAKEGVPDAIDFEAFIQGSFN